MADGLPVKIMRDYNILFLCAESSGDLLASELMNELKSYGLEHSLNFQFSGIFGKSCESLGLKSLIPLSDIAVMGIFEIFSALGRLREAKNRVLDYVENHHIDMVICVDGFAFSHPLAVKIQKLSPHTKIIRYVAPKLWAWGNWRAKKLRGIYDVILSNLPFEPDFFKNYEIQTHFVGHSVTQRIKTPIPEEKEYSILLLAGSRKSEITKLMPIFFEVLDNYPNYPFVMPIADGQEKWFLDNYGQKLSHYQNLKLIDGTSERFEAFEKSYCAIAASGTVSLELMMADVPAVIIYKFSYLTQLLAKLLVKVKYATLLNILLDKMSFPEYIGENCRFDFIDESFIKLVKKEFLYDQIRQDFVIGRKFFKVYNETGQEITPTKKAVHYLEPFFTENLRENFISLQEKRDRLKKVRTRRTLFPKIRLRKKK